MRNLIVAGLMATSLLPAAAQAQYIDRGEARELRRDRADIRDERRDLNRAYRSGDDRDIRDARQEYRGARQEYREDRRDAYRDGNRNWGRNDWRGYRETNRNLYRGGGWRSDNRYRSFNPGVRIYEKNNSGRWYDFGFLIGASISLGGSGHETVEYTTRAQ